MVAVIWWCGGRVLRFWSLALGPEIDGCYYVLASLVFICVNYLLSVSVKFDIARIEWCLPLVYSYAAYEYSCAAQYVPHWYQYSESQ